MKTARIVQIAVLGTNFLLAGCNSLSQDSEQLLAAQQEKVTVAVERSRQAVIPPSVIRAPLNVLGVLEGPRHGDALPARCEQPITLRASMPLSLAEIASRIAHLLEAPVQLDPRIAEDAEDPLQRRAAAAAANAEALQNPPGFPVGRFPSNKAEPIGGGGGFKPDLSGNCAEIFDRIAGEFDLHWEMRRGVLSFDKYVVRTFPIWASATTSQFTSTMTSGGNASSSGASSSGTTTSTGGGNAQSASVTSSNDVWAELDNGLKALMTKTSKFTISRAAGTVTVVAPPRTMADIAAYIDQLNNILSATIAVEVSAIYVTVDDKDNYGLDLNALYQIGTQKIGLNGLVPTITQSPGTGSIAILSPPAGNNNFATHFAGSQLFLNAVSS